MRAISSVKKLMENEFHGSYILEIIDVLKNPQLALEVMMLDLPVAAAGLAEREAAAAAPTA